MLIIDNRQSGRQIDDCQLLFLLCGMALLRMEIHVSGKKTVPETLLHRLSAGSEPLSVSIPLHTGRLALHRYVSKPPEAVSRVAS